MRTCNLKFHKNVMYVSLHFYYVASIYKPGVGPEGLKNVARL